MNIEKTKVGFALCGSYCTFEETFETLQRLENQYILTPIMSENAYKTDTRFGLAQDHIKTLEDICKTKVIHTIKGAEPIGPQKLFDVLVIAPCTGNTLAKLANGVTDTAVTMAAKAHMRNKRPLVIAVSSNDSLSANGKNIGMLLNSKNIYFVPFKQDDAINKETSLVADFTKMEQTIEAALQGQQLQPIITT